MLPQQQRRRRDDGSGGPASIADDQRPLLLSTTLSSFGAGRFLSSETIAGAACASRGCNLAAAEAASTRPVDISVVLPVYNALAVGLPIALRDILRQEGASPSFFFCVCVCVCVYCVSFFSSPASTVTPVSPRCAALDCPPYEVVVTDDGSTDGSREWLVELAAALGVRGVVRLEEEEEEEASARADGSSSGGVDGSGSGDDEHHLGGRTGATTGAHASRRGGGAAISTGPAAGSGSGSGSGSSDGSSDLVGGVDPEAFSPALVAAAASAPLVRLVLLSTSPAARGQGAAMDKSLHAARGDLLALMESDDTRPCDTLAQLVGRFGAGEGSGGDDGDGDSDRHTSGASGGGEGLPKGRGAAGGNKQARQRFRGGRAEDVRRPDAVCSEVHLVTPPPATATANASGLTAFAGMQRYIVWQNGLVTNQQMARARFVEIPALHQTSLYRRRDCLSLGGYGANPQWPVDMDFWMRWFAAGKTCVKVCGAGSAAGAAAQQLPSTTTTTAAAAAAAGPPAPPPPYPTLYGWRQHSGQGTRNSGRCSLENLRRCKVHYLAVDPAGPCHGRHVVVVSMGATLAAYVDDLRRSGACRSVEGLAWDTKRWAGRNGCPPPEDLPAHVEAAVEDADASAAGAAQHIQHQAISCSSSSSSASASASPLPVVRQRRVRLFVYGAAKARRRVQTMLARDWDDAHDWFAA